MTIQVNMYITAAVGLLAVLLGKFMRRKIRFLEKFCVPAPVAGGLVFSILHLILTKTVHVSFSFDKTLESIMMMAFFTTVGFQADIKTVKKGGIGLLVFLAATTVMIVLQNGVALGASKLFGFSPLLGMCTGSIPMIGGHGTSAAFGPQLEEMGLKGATTYATAAATFGLVAGSLIGGPLAEKLIRRKGLITKEETGAEKMKEETAQETLRMFSGATFRIILAMGIGSVISMLISLTGVTLPGYIGAMLAAAVIRNVTERSDKLRAPMPEIGELSNITLAVFLGIAMITLDLAQLADLALPLIVLLTVQLVLMLIYARFVVFNVMGRDYDAAVMVSGFCGFGMGATPNALANMNTVCNKYRYSEKAFLIVPLTGALFVDFINGGILTVIMNLLK